MSQKIPPPPTQRRGIRRCPSCGSHLRGRGRACSICGASLPWRLTPLGLAAEGAVVVGGVVLVVGGLLMLRDRGGPGLDDREANMAALLDAPPTSAPTFTRPPPATRTLPPPTRVPPTATPLPAVITYTVVSGDTLSGISQQFDVATDDIVAMNTDTLPSIHDLFIGQQLRIPIARSAQVAEAGDDSRAAPGDVGGEPAEAEPGEAGEAGDTSVLDETAAARPATVLDPNLAEVLGLGPAADVTVLAGARLEEEGTAAAPRDAEEPGAVLETEKTIAVSLPAPRPAMPAAGALVSGESPVLRWSSVGVLEPGAYYAVELRGDGDDPEEPARILWVVSNATAVRLPGDLRPSLGTTRTFTWTVSVRRRTGRLLGEDTGETVGQMSAPRTFVWAP